MEIIGLLVEAGADVNAQDKQEHTALMYASGAKFSLFVRGVLPARMDKQFRNRANSIYSPRCGIRGTSGNNAPRPRAG